MVSNGGAETVASLIDASLVDELQLIVYPLVAGVGKPLFGTARRRRNFELRGTEQLSNDRVRLVYALA
jgi:dihydrofolate reductase